MSKGEEVLRSLRQETERRAALNSAAVTKHQEELRERTAREAAEAAETQRLLEALPKMTVWTDGASSGNPGLSGWGAVLCNETTGKRATAWGSIPELECTNSRAEMTPVVQVLDWLHANKGPCNISILMDSQFLAAGIQDRSRNRKANKDLWAEIDRVIGLHGCVRAEWIRRSSRVENVEADKLAGRGAKRAAEQYWASNQTPEAHFPTLKEKITG